MRTRKRQGQPRLPPSPLVLQWRSRAPGAGPRPGSWGRERGARQRSGAPVLKEASRAQLLPTPPSPLHRPRSPEAASDTALTWACGAHGSAPGAARLPQPALRRATRPPGALSHPSRPPKNMWAQQEPRSLEPALLGGQDPSPGAAGTSPRGPSWGRDATAAPRAVGRGVQSVHVGTGDAPQWGLPGNTSEAI